MGKLFKFRRMQINEERTHTHTHANDMKMFFSSLRCHIKSKVENFYIFIKEFAFFSVLLLLLLARVYYLFRQNGVWKDLQPRKALDFSHKHHNKSTGVWRFISKKVFQKATRNRNNVSLFALSCFYIHFVSFNFIPQFEFRLRICNNS